MVRRPRISAGEQTDGLKGEKKIGRKEN